MSANQKITPPTVNELEINWYNALQEPFTLYGFCQTDDELKFRRVPAEVAKNTSPSIEKLGKESSGGRVRFSTNSPFIALRVKFQRVDRTRNQTLQFTAGFDLYVDGEFGSRFIRDFRMPYDLEDSYEDVIHLDREKMHSYTIYFPAHSVVECVEIGIKPDALLEEHRMPYRDIQPVIFYGSSIVHGISASRPSNTYTSMISRMLNIDFKNLGFSGAAKGEEALARWMATQQMSIFVCDYDHNALTVEHLEQTHYRLYEIFREKNPNTPYVMVTRPDYGTKESSQNFSLQLRDVIMTSYLKARAKGDKNVYFIDGLSFHVIPHQYEMNVDSCHPNDAGFMRMANSIGTVIQHILEKQADADE